MNAPLLNLKNVCLSHSNSIFSKGKNFSLQNISFRLQQNDSISIVGESATGKTSLITALMKLHPIDSGEIIYKGANIASFNKKDLRKYRRCIQPVFQNYDAALNPYLKIKKSLFPGFAINLTQSENNEQVHRFLELMDLKNDILEKHPHQLSGGEKQRISILRALITKPEIIILDEPFSSLDIISQDKLLQLLQKIKEELQLAYIFITHKTPLTRFFANKFYILQNNGMRSFDNYDDLVQNYDDLVQNYE